MQLFGAIILEKHRTVLIKFIQLNNFTAFSLCCIRLRTIYYSVENARLDRVATRQINKLYLQSSQLLPPSPGGQTHCSGNTHFPCPQPPVQTAEIESLRCMLRYMFHMSRISSASNTHELYNLPKGHESPFSQIWPVHPLEQMQLPLRHVPPFLHEMRQKSVQKKILL